jgi:hypothetical protein
VTARSASDVPTTAEARLVARFGEAVSPETIRCVLRDAYSALASTSRIATYVGVLAERAAEAELATMVADGGPTGAGVVTPGLAARLLQSQ